MDCILVTFKWEKNVMMSHRYLILEYRLSPIKSNLLNQQKLSDDNWNFNFGEIMKNILVTFKWELKVIVGHRHLMFVTDYSCNEILLTLVSKTVRWKLKF